MSEELRTLRSTAAERELWLHGFERVMRVLKENAHALASLEKTEAIHEAFEASCIALSNAGIVRLRAKEALESLYSQIRAEEQAEDARRLLASVRDAVAALNAALEAAEVEPHW